MPDIDADLIADLTTYYEQDAHGRALRPLMEERIRRRDLFVDQLLDLGSARVLEVGTGPGVDAAAMIARGLTVVGVDLSPEHVRLARETGADVHVAPAQRLPFDDASCDALWSMSVLMHLPDDGFDAALREMVRVAVPGAPGAFGLWGGDDVAGPNPDDTIEPKRYFNWRTEASVRRLVEPYAEVDAFDTWLVAGGFTYQWVEIRFCR
jgi:SAM-dependent methyltransferase